MITLKNEKEIALMDRASRIVLEVLEDLRGAIRPGISTGDLDRLAEDGVFKRGGKLAFKGLYGFPATICISINDELVHGIPSAKRVLNEGDIVSLDMGAVHEGFYGDAAITVGVGAISPEAQALIDATRVCLYRGIAAAKAGGRIGDIGAAIQPFAEARGYSVVREYLGHGIGRKLHEAPQIPNYVGGPDAGKKLVPGMALAIEPMINCGSPEVVKREDDWTVATRDGKLCAHFEHTLVVTQAGPRILGLDPAESESRLRLAA